MVKLRPVREAWREVALPITAAWALSLLLDALVQTPTTAAELVGRVFASVFGTIVAVLIGMYLGKYAWPRRGLGLAKALLRRDAIKKRRPVLALTHRPDFRSPMPRRIFEVVGFAAGISIIVTAILGLVQARPFVTAAGSGLLVLVALWGAFLLVPYWTFANLGLRRVDPVRWIVEPVSQRYARSLRLSNGALMLVAAVLTVNLALRVSDRADVAVFTALRLLIPLIASVLVVATAGVAYFNRTQRALERELETEALRLGVHDARGMSDGDLVPKLPR